jgi:hypothetical protein
MASRFILPLADVGNGISPSDGAKLTFFITGTGTLKDTYSDEAKTTPNTNPVIADGDGLFPEIWIDGSYKVTLTDKNDVPQWEEDPIHSTLNSDDIMDVVEATENLAIVFTNYADLVSGTLPDGSSITLTAGQNARILGRVTEGDGGDNTYLIGTFGTADGGSIVDLDSGLQAKGLFPRGFHSSAQWGVVADSDGTTGNGTDDTTAWLAAIAYATANDVMLTSPDGNTRITATLDMTLLIAKFKCQFIKDFDGVGITFIEGGSVFTEIDRLRIDAVGTQSASAHNITTIDSRMKLWRCRTRSAGGDGYRHTDDDGNNNHCILDIESNANAGWNINILKGAEGDDSNNWTVNWQTFSGGGGVNIESDVKYIRGIIKAEDSLSYGLITDTVSSADLDVYLENNATADYSLGSNTSFITIEGRLGSGTDSSTTNRISNGGNQAILKGSTPVANLYAANNVSDSSSEFMMNTWQGASGNLLAEEKIYGSGLFEVNVFDPGVATRKSGFSSDEAGFTVRTGNTAADKIVIVPGTGSPEGVVTGRIGDMFLRTDGGAGTTLYIKETGTATNTGWVAK